MNTLFYIFKINLLKISSLLWILLLALSLNSWSQASISGPTSICLGEPGEYNILNSDPLLTYTWSVYPTTVTFVEISNGHIYISWIHEGDFILTCNDGTVDYTANISVYHNSMPYITFSSDVGCQESELHDDKPGNYIVDNTDGCINVCENSTVTYTLNSNESWFGSIGNNSWSISGGSIIAVDGITLSSPTNTVTATTDIGEYSSITVLWGLQGPGTIQATVESPSSVCASETVELCINIIESPVALFYVIGVSQSGENGCYNVCLNQEVYFDDASIFSLNSPIISWYWNFGDGQSSALQNPSHAYVNDGNYHVELTVTNQCNCTSSFHVTVCVNALEPITIECPGVLCENDFDVYWSPQTCTPYNWTVTGGTIIDQLDNTVTVSWDNVGSDGFGYVGLDGSYCGQVCPANIVYKIPVILQESTIVGPQVTCTETGYIYTLPAWPATNFTWEIINNTSGATFNTFADNGHMVEVNAGLNGGSFELTCSYVNTVVKTICGGSASIVVQVTPIPEIIHPEKLCLLQACTCSVSGVTIPGGITTWSIRKPDNSTLSIQSAVGALTQIFNGNDFDLEGTYFISASNPLSFCDPNEVTVEVKAPPATPSLIEGAFEVCLDYPYTYECADNIQGAFTHWTVTGGTITGMSGGSYYGPTITVNWTNPTTRTIAVQRAWEDLPTCVSDVLQESVELINLSGTIVGHEQPCEDAVYNYSIDFVDDDVVADYFNWSLLDPTLGSITSGQGTANVDITFLYIGSSTPTTCIFKCEVIKCGIVTTIYKAVMIQTNTYITDVLGDDEVCSGEWVMLTALASGAPALEYVWNVNGLLYHSISPSFTNLYLNLTDANSIVYVSVQAESQCNNELSQPYLFPVTVMPLPPVNVTPGGPINLDLQNFVPQTLYVSNTGTGTFSYQWYFDDLDASSNPVLPITGATSQTFIVMNYPPQTSPVSTTFLGEYYCVVTNTNSGCIVETNHVLVTAMTFTLCYPVEPAGILNMNAALLSCGTIQSTCTTLGTFPGNILYYTWEIDADASDYYIVGNTNGTLTTSPEYHLREPGLYNIALFVYYENQDPNEPPCELHETDDIIVPFLADLVWSLGCDAQGDQYILTLTDNSPVFPGTPNVVTHIWDGVNIHPNSSQVAVAVNPSTLYTTAVVILSGSNSCQEIQEVTTPALPVADFEISTTFLNNPTNPSKTCQERVVEFSSSSTPTSSIVSYNWDLGDITYSHNPDVKKTYPSGVFGTISPILTVSDLYGCWDSKDVELYVYENTLAFNQFGPYTPLKSEICFGSNHSGITPSVSYGQLPYSFQWYQNENPIPGETGSQYTGIPGISGAYWVQVTDAYNCLLVVNPEPARVSVKYPPDAVIDAEQDVCFGDVIKLNAITGVDANTPLNYHWVHTFNGVPTNYYTKEVTISNAPIGTHLFELEVAFNLPLNTCSSNSGIFNVVVHPLPATPQVSYSVNNCDLYEIELSATSTLNPTPIFNWSTGQSGSSITVYHGGAFEVEITDQFGCKKATDIQIPQSPSYYFWRFPKGCYEYCPEELDRWIDGPTHIEFPLWEWYYNGSLVTNNGIYNSSGSSFCDPLMIAMPQTGDGEGDYSWGLNTGLCFQEYGVMNWRLVECCELDIQNLNMVCIGTNLYSFTLDLEVLYCNQADLLVYAVNSFGDPAGIVTIATPSSQIVHNGTNPIEGIIEYTIPLGNDITLIFQIVCGQTCIATYSNKLPPCGSKSTFVENQEVLVSDHLETSLQVYPNPANDEIFFNVQLKNQEIENQENYLLVYDLLGQLISILPIRDSSSVFSFNVKNLSPGTYFVAVKNSSGAREVKTFVVE